MKKRILSLFLALTLCLTLLPTSAFAEGGDVSISDGVIGSETGGEGGGVLVPPGGSTGEGGGIYTPPSGPAEGGGGTYIPEEDTRTEIWCVSKPDSIGRSYDGTTDGGTIPIDLTFTDGTNEIKLKEGTGFTAKKTFDSADAGWHTVTVEITLIGEAAVKYKLKAGEEKFEIGGNINKAYPDLTVSLSKTTCTVGEKLLPLLSVEGAPEDAEVTYYYAPINSGYLEFEGSEVVPKIDENTAISEPGTYYVYAKTGETKNYKEERSATVELTVNEPVVEAASVTRADGTDGGTYESLPAALNAAQDGDTVRLLANHVTDADALNALGEDFTFEQYASIVPVVTKTLTLDLNHKTVDYLEVGFSETNEETQKKETLATGNLTVTSEAAYGRILNLLFMAGALDIQSGEIGGSECMGLLCDADSGSVTVSNGTVYGLTVLEGASVTVNGGSNHAGEWVVGSGATLKITDGTFGEVQFTRNGTIAISGGTFKSIKSEIAEELQPLMSLLDTQKVHAFYKGDDVQDGNATELADVTVKEHTHTMVNSRCACGFSCAHTNTEGASTIDKDGKCTVCGTQFAAGIGETYYTDVPSALNAAADGQTVKLLANEMLPDGIYVSKTLTLDLDGHSLSGYSLNVGGRTAMSQVRTGKLTVIDSSGGNGAVGVTVRDGGTLVFNPENDNTTLLQLEVWGGTVELYGGKISRSGLRLNNNITLGNLLPGQAGLAYYRGDTQLTLEEAASQTCDLVVKLCSHGGKNGFDGTNCPYCNAPAVAETALNGSEGGRLRRRFADLQTALDADRDGGSTLSLLTDVTGDYTINGTRDTGIDLNGHSIHGTVTVKAATGMDTTTLSNTKNTTTASIDTVVANEGANLAGSGFPAVIGTLKLAEGATWANILYEPNRLGYKVLNGDGTHKWYAPADVPAGSTELNNVIINRLPITSKTLSLKVDGKNLTGSNPKVERGTTVRLCANCNTKDADVAIYVGEIGGDGIPTYIQKKAEYKKIGTMWYYVVDFDADTIGTYSIYFTASKDGYSVSSNPKMLTVTKLSLSKAVITFPNGNESVYQPYNTTTGVPPYVVTYNGSELKAGVDYTVVRGDSHSTVGTATLTIKATDGGDYTGQKTARWTVAAHKATISVGDIIKVYDGTTDLPANASIKLKSADSRYAPSGGPLPLVAGEDYQILNASYDSASASEDEKTVSFTIKLTDRNYTFEDGTTQKDFVLNGADVSQTFKINQATVTPNEITQYVFNDLAKTYEIDLRTLLPELPVGCEYGKIHNRGCDYHFTDSTYLDSSNCIFVSNEGILTLPIVAAHSANVNDQIGTLTVPIVSTNYQPFELTIKVVIGQRIPLDQSGVSVSATAITYGQTLAESTLTATGSMICPRTQAVIPGTFAWKDGTIKPNAGSYDAEWTFTPAEGYEEYAPATGTATVTVEPAELTGVSVRAPSTYYTGKPQHASTIAFGQSVDGTTVTFTYSDKVDGDYTSDGPTFTDAGTYTVYYKAEAANHKTATGTFTVTIAPLPISLLSVERISKSYDGTANVTLTASRLTFFSKTASRSGIILPDTALTFSDAQFTMKQADGSYLPSPDVGNGKALSFTMTLANDNYVFEGKPEGTKTVSDTFATDDTTRFTITRAAAPALTAYQVTQKYSLKTEQTITLPDLKSLGMPGDAQVSDTNAFHSGSYSPAGRIQDGWGIDVNTGAITYALADGAAAGDVITFTLLVRSKNYEDATVTVILTLTERDAPILTLPDIITVDYTGAEIPVSAVTGKSAAFDGKDVPGTWSWKAGQAITNATDTGSKAIVFTPADLVNYHPVEGEVYVIISRVAPDYTAPAAIDGLTYSGSAQALVRAGSTAHGKLLYSLSKDGTYSETIPTGTDAGEYTVWYKVAGDSNHKDSQPGSVTATIAPKTVTATVTVSGGSLTYTGDPLKPNVIVKDGDTVISPEEYDVSYRDNVNAGTATVTVRNKAGGNYTVSGSATFEIGKAASEVRTAPGANAGLVYNGGEQTLITAGTALGGKLKYRLGETGEFTEALPKATDAGTYTVYCMVEGDGNHRDSEVQSLTVTIDKAKVTVKALDKRIYTDDKAPDLSKPVLDKDYTISAMFGEDALTGDIKLACVDANGAEITPDTAKVGKVIIRAGGLTAPNGNYTVVFVDGTLTIDERPVYTIKATAGIHGSITPSGDVDVLHGGSQTFTIAANRGYAISNVKIDGVSIGAVKSYTFENVTGNHTIDVTFMKANGNPQTGVMVDEVTGEYYVG
jgi:hypothetical protein